MMNSAEKNNFAMYCSCDKMGNNITEQLYVIPIDTLIKINEISLSSMKKPRIVDLFELCLLHA